MNPRTMLWIAAASATAAVLCVVEAIGSLHAPTTVATFLAPSSSPSLVGTGFAPAAVFPATDAREVPQNLRLYGSFIGSDRNTGEARTAWYQAVPNVALMVAGYPGHAGIALSLEVDTSARIVDAAVTASNPGERWTEVSVPLRDVAGAKRFRVHAVDHATNFQGWVGFSEPFTVGDAPSSQMFGAVGRVAIYFAAFFALVSAAICTALTVRAPPVR